MPRRLGEILRWVPLVGGTAGFFLALRYARERALVPAALAVLGGVAFVGIGIAGLSLLGRYLFLPAAMLAIFFGYAALGWSEMPRERVRAFWIGRRGRAADRVRRLDDLPPDRSARLAA